MSLNGIMLNGVPLLTLYQGNVYWVDSNGGGGSVGSFAKPVASISTAMGLCTAANGDKIMCKPGHVENISEAAALVCDKSDVAIIGTGSGGNQSKITFDTADTASITVTAPNVTLCNLWIYIDFANIDGMIEVAATGTYFTVDKCRWTGGSNALDIEEGIRLAAAANNFSFTNNDVRFLTGGDTESLVYTVGECVDMTVSGNFIAMPSSDAHFSLDATALTGAPLFSNNVMVQMDTTTGFCVDIDAATVAVFTNERYAHDKSNTMVANALTASYCVRCYGVELNAVSSLIWPATATAWT